MSTQQITRSTSKEISDITEKYTYISKARAVLMGEYIKQTAERHNKWKTENKHMWLTQGILLPYDNISFSYPSEDDVAKLALKMYNDAHGIKPESENKQKETVSDPKTDANGITDVEVKDTDGITIEKLEKAVADIDNDVVNDETLTAEEKKIESERKNAYLRNLLVKFISMVKELDNNNNNKNEEAGK